MQRDGEVVVVDAPELLEDRLGLDAGVDEDERGLVRLISCVDLADAHGAPNGRPTAAARAVSSMATLGRGAAVGDDEVGQGRAGFGCGTRKRRRSSGSATVAERPTLARSGASCEQAREAERQQIAALRGDQRMQFVEHDAPERAEQIRRVGARRAAAQAAPAWSAGCRAGRGVGAGASMPACRRCASRCGSAAPSRRPGAPDCARRRPRAPSAARCRACAARPRGGGRGRRRRACGLSPPSALRRPRSAPPGSAGTRPASCRRRSARSAAPSGRARAFASNSSWCVARGPAAAREPARERLRQECSGVERRLDIHDSRMKKAVTSLQAPSRRRRPYGSSTDQQWRRRRRGRTP